MIQTFVIDSIETHRNYLNQQISQLGLNTEVENCTIEQAETKILGSKKSDAWVFIAPTEDFSAMTDFIEAVRSKTALLVVVTEKISAGQIRKVLASGADQILQRPFSSAQLRQKIEDGLLFRKRQLELNAKPFGCVVQEINDSYYRVSVQGFLSVDCELPVLRPVKPDAKMIVDCEQLKGMTSIGIRTWILWFKDLSKDGFSSFEFENIHQSILHPVNMVHGFIPATGRINSFYLYYGNEETGIDKEFKIARDVDFTDQQMNLPKFKSALHEGKMITFEIDELVQRFLKFYYAPIVIT